MVNSPSWPNVRPLSPMECGGMTPLWNWETCLPVHSRRPVSTARIQNKSNHHPFSRRSVVRGYPTRSTKPEIRTRFRPQSRQKPLQSCLIKANQGKRPKSPFARLASDVVSLPLPSRSPKSGSRDPLICNQGSIKAKNPVIVHNQGISTHPPKSPNAKVGRVTPCAPSRQTQTPLLATIPMVNQEIVVGRRRRAQDCPPYLAWPFSRVSRLSRFPLPGFPDLQNPKSVPGSAPNQGKNPCNRA